MEKVYYPLAIRETVPTSSETVSAPEEAETVSAPEEAETTRPESALAVPTLNRPAEGGELPGVTETHESSNLEAPQEATESIVSVQASHVEEPALLVQPLQTIPPADVSKGPEANPAQLPKEGAKIKSKK